MSKPVFFLEVGLHVGRSLRDRHSLIPLLGRHTFVRLPVPRRKRPAPELLFPLDYQRLNPRTLLAADASTSDEPPPLIFDLPPEVSATISALLGNQANYSSGIWRPAGDTASYPANQWSIAQDPTSLAPESWRNYSVNTNLPSGLTSSAFKATAPLDGGGHLVFIRKRQSNRSIGGGPAGGGIEGGGGGIPGNETVATSLTTTIVSVPTLAAANAINPLTFNPLLYSSRLSVTANHQFNYKDTTALGQIRSYTVNNSYQIGLSFVWGGQQTTTETDPASGGVTTRIVNYNSYGTVTLTGSHTFVGTLAVENSWLVEHGYLFGSNTSAVGLHSTNHVAANYVEGNLNGNSGFGATANGTSQANFHYTGTGTSAYVGTSHLYTYSGAQSGSLARQDTGTYSLQSAPQVSVSYTSRKDLAPSSGPELFGIADLNGPTGTNSSPPDYATQSLIANSSGTFSAQSPIQAHGYYGLQTTENLSYSGTKLNTATYAGFDYANSSGGTFQSSDSISYRFESPQRIALASIAFSASGSGGQISILDTDAMLELEDPPSIDPNEDVLTGAIISTGQLLEDTFELTTSLALGSRGVYSTRSSGSTPGSPETLVAGANAYLNDFTPLALHSPGTATSELNITAAPIASDDRATHYYWSAWSGESTSDSILSGPGIFNSQAEFGEAGDITLTQDGESGYLTTFSSTSRASEDGLSLFGTAPRVTRNNNWDLADPAAVAPYELRPENQSGNGGFIYIHFDSDNENAGHGSDSSSYDYTSILTPYANGQPTPNATLDNYSGTVAQTPNGLLITTGGSEVSAESVLDLDQTDGIDKVIVAMWDRTGSAAGDHRFESSLDIYEFSESKNGSGGGSVSQIEELEKGQQSQETNSSGNSASLGNGLGLVHAFYELDEAFSSSGDGTEDPLTGLLANADGMNRSLKYKATRTAPLRTESSLDSSWNVDMRSSTTDLLDFDSASSGPSSLSGYLIALGTNSQVNLSGGSNSVIEMSQIDEETKSQFSLEWDLHAWRDGTSTDEPAEIFKSGALKSSGAPQTERFTLNSALNSGVDFLADGVYLIVNGTNELEQSTAGELYNPRSLIDEEHFNLPNGSSRSESKTVPVNEMRKTFEQTVTTIQSLEDYGSATRWSARNINDVVSVGWGLEPTTRKAGILDSQVATTGSASDHLALIEQTKFDQEASANNPTSGHETSIHTTIKNHNPTWSVTDEYRQVYLADGNREVQHSIGGNFANQSSINTNGSHDHKWLALPSTEGDLVHKSKLGHYDSRTNFGITGSRSGSISKTFAIDDRLTAVSGEFRINSVSTGDALANDRKEATKIKSVGITIQSLIDLDSSLQAGAAGAGLFASSSSPETGTAAITARRIYERASEDHFQTAIERKSRPELQADGSVKFSNQETFESDVSGSLVTKDTRSVQSSLGIRGWFGDYWLFSPVTIENLDSYFEAEGGTIQSAAGGAGLIVGFDKESSYDSFNYRGEPIETSFIPLLTSGIGGGQTWGPPSEGSEFGGGPQNPANLLGDPNSVLMGSEEIAAVPGINVSLLEAARLAKDRAPTGWIFDGPVLGAWAGFAGGLDLPESSIVQKNLADANLTLDIAVTIAMEVLPGASYANAVFTAVGGEDAWGNEASSLERGLVAGGTAAAVILPIATIGAANLLKKLAAKSAKAANTAGNVATTINSAAQAAQKTADDLNSMKNSATAFVKAPKETFRGGPHIETKLPWHDGLESHHMPAKSLTCLDPDVGPAIQMHRRDHLLTSSHGSRPGSADYRFEIEDLLIQRRTREAMAREIRDVRRAALEGSSNMRKYNEAIREMLEYARKIGFFN